MPNTREALPSDYTSFYTKGTIKVKNADGQLVPFYPNTKEDCVYDENSNNSLNEIISNMEDDIEEAANSGGVKVIYDEITENNASSYSNETMITVIETSDDEWIFTVEPETYYNSSTQSYVTGSTGIPISLDFSINDGLELYIDWGDGTSETIVSPGFYSTNPYRFNANLHTYSNPGIYQVTVKCSDWENLYLSSLWGPSSTTVANGNRYQNHTKAIDYWRNTVISLDSKLPKVKGVMVFTDRDTWTYGNSFEAFLTDSCKLKKINSRFLDNNPNITSLKRFFKNYYENTAITDFVMHIKSENITDATDFIRYNENTNRIIYVPEGSTTQTTFNGVASSLDLTIIAE